MSTKFKLIIVRHGETEFNKLKLLQGHLDVPLNELGKIQARTAGKHINDIKFMLAYSSDLARAKETCELLLSENENFCESRRTKPVIRLDKRLRERTFGNMEGKPSIELINAARKAHKSVVQFTADGGETLQDVKVRAKDFFVSLCDEINNFVTSNNVHNDLNILLVSHGGFIRTLFSIWLEAFTFIKNESFNDCIVTNASRSCVIVTLPEIKELSFQSTYTDNDITKLITVRCAYFNESV